MSSLGLWTARNGRAVGVTIEGVRPPDSAAPDPDWYSDNVLAHASPPAESRSVGDGPVAAWTRRWGDLARSGDPVLKHAAANGFVLTVADLQRLGISRQFARTQITRRRWTVAGHGAVAAIPPPGQPRELHALACAAAVRRCPSAVVSGRSAAILHGLPTVAVPDKPELTLFGPAAGSGRTAATHRFAAALTSAEVTTWFGIPTTTAARTLVDLGRHGRFDAIMAVDAALRERRVAHLEAALDRAGRWPGVRAAPAVLGLGSPLAESPLESVTRLRLHDAGFPEPQLQVVIAGFRVDFCWPCLRLILEADGRGKYEADALWREKRRETELRRAGFQVERVIWSDVTRGWGETAARLRTLFPPTPRTG